MPAFVAWIVAGLSSLAASRLGSWIIGALLFMGIEMAATSFVVGPALAKITAAMGGVTGDAAGWLAFFNIDKYITIILSAYAGAAARNALFFRKKA